MDRRSDVSLTCTSFSGNPRLILSTPGADGEQVESPGHQITEHTLVTGPLHRLVLKECVVVQDCYIIIVFISSCMTPGHLQDIFSG